MLYLLDLPFPISSDLGAVGVLVIVVLAIVLGRLIPRSTHKDRIADKDRQIEALQDTVTKQGEQQARSMEVLQVIIKMLEDIKRDHQPSGRHRGGPS